MCQLKPDRKSGDCTHGLQTRLRHCGSVSSHASLCATNPVPPARARVRLAQRSRGRALSMPSSACRVCSTVQTSRLRCIELRGVERRGVVLLSSARVSLLGLARVLFMQFYLFSLIRDDTRGEGTRDKASWTSPGARAVPRVVSLPPFT